MSCRSCGMSYAEDELGGPRPSQPSEVDHYEPEHFMRLLAKPGVTGMWQVSGRSNLSFEDAVRLDSRLRAAMEPTARHPDLVQDRVVCFVAVERAELLPRSPSGLSRLVQSRRNAYQDGFRVPSDRRRPL